jgi:hypothetical protein
MRLKLILTWMIQRLRWQLQKYKQGMKARKEVSAMKEKEIKSSTVIENKV